MNPFDVYETGVLAVQHAGCNHLGNVSQVNDRREGGLVNACEALCGAKQGCAWLKADLRA